jgi:chemotaxis protein methyltransferase CheR
MTAGLRQDNGPGAMARPPGGFEPQTHLSDREFAELAERVHALTGIMLPLHKRQMVISRLRKRLRTLGLADFGAYVRHLDSPDGRSETGELINVVTTNLTAFFRESHHFEDLGTILAGAPGGGGPRRFRIWSSACSTGEEPYSIAMTAANALRGRPAIDLRILATDLDTDALAHASAGLYPAERAEGCPPGFRRGYFESLPGGEVRVARPIRSLITFNQLNLHEAWPVSGPFDVIFCRNVLIYFDAPAKQRIVARFVELLRPGGTLYLGHSESMLGNHPKLVNQGRTIFRKRA